MGKIYCAQTRLCQFRNGQEPPGSKGECEGEGCRWVCHGWFLRCGLCDLVLCGEEDANGGSCGLVDAVISMMYHSTSLMNLGICS